MKRLLQALQVAAAAFGAYLIYRVFGKFDAGDVLAALGQTPALNIAAALGLSALSFVLISLNESLAVRYATGRPLPFGRLLLVATAAIGIGHAVGLAALSSGAVRYRMYTRLGLKGMEVAKIVVFSGVSAALGLFIVGIAAFLADAGPVRDLFADAPSLLPTAAAIGLTGLSLYALACWRHASVRVRKTIWSAPPVALAAGQMVCGALNVSVIAGTLYMCLAPFVPTPYTTVASLYPSSEFAAIVGHVPGSWGVLEFVFTTVVAGAGVLTGVTLFRVIYYLAPLAIGAGIFALSEARSPAAAPRVKAGVRP